MSKKTITIQNDHPLVIKISELIENGRKQVAVAVNLSMVYTYFEIGRMIVEDEQQGENRAEYGKSILKELSVRLTAKFEKGFSVDNLQNMRRFYLSYSKYETASRILLNPENKQSLIRQKPSAESPKFALSWSHYLVLINIENTEERRFYEIEAAQNQWSLSEFKRQLNSALYERLALSRDKKKVKQLSQKGHVVENTKDLIKEPYVLEFMGLQDKPSYSESQLEASIIEHLQLFLLELGKGFSFVGRQVRFTFDEKHFKVDLVFYNRLLRCFVVIDLKLGEIVHQDLGQMQMYVNYYDRYVKVPEENPTIGILLCQKKNSSIVELTLPKDANIYASQYILYLPDKKQLQNKLKEWVEEFEHGVEDRKPVKRIKKRLTGVKNE